MVQADETPTDPRWNQQWDMMKISAPAAWSTQTDSSGVVVAIIDSGIDFTHPDLQANLWVNSDGSHGFNCIRCSNQDVEQHNLRSEPATIETIPITCWR